MIELQDIIKPGNPRTSWTREDGTVNPVTTRWPQNISLVHDAGKTEPGEQETAAGSILGLAREQWCAAAAKEAGIDSTQTKLTRLFEMQTVADDSGRTLTTAR